MKKNIWKSIGALLVGFITVAILSIATDMLFEVLHIFPPQNQPQVYAWWMLPIALLYRTLFTLFGGFVTAKLAPNKKVLHAIILGTIGMVFATGGAIVNWDKSLNAEWYPLLLIFVSIPATWLGGRLQGRK